MGRETGNTFRGVIPNIPYYVTSDFEKKVAGDRYQMYQVCDIGINTILHHWPAASYLF